VSKKIGFRCVVDNDSRESCVIDEGMPEGCTLAAAGTKRDECEYWLRFPICVWRESRAGRLSPGCTSLVMYGKGYRLEPWEICPLCGNDVEVTK